MSFDVNADIQKAISDAKEIRESRKMTQTDYKPPKDKDERPADYQKIV